MSTQNHRGTWLWVVVALFSLCLAPVWADEPETDRDRRRPDAGKKTERTQQSPPAQKTAAKSPSQKAASKTNRKQANAASQKSTARTASAAATGSRQASRSSRQTTSRVSSKTYGTKTTPTRRRNTTVKAVSAARMNREAQSRDPSSRSTSQTVVTTQPVRSAETTTVSASAQSRSRSAKTVVQITRPASKSTRTAGSGTSRRASERNDDSAVSIAMPTDSTKTVQAAASSPHTSARSSHSSSRAASMTKVVSRSAPVRVNDIASRPDRVRITSSVASPRSGDRASSHSLSGDGRYLSTKSLNRTTGYSRSAAGPRIAFNDHRFHVKGKPSKYRPRPFVPRRIYRNIYYFYNDPFWSSYGSYLTFHWSDSSCGLAIYLPFSNACYPLGCYGRRYPTGYYGLSYYYPRYHRKYLFVSLGGYWPHNYRYRRYYWYGCHPHYWYGARVIQPVTYNTYSCYGSTVGSNITVVSDSDIIDQPTQQNAADLVFDNAVQLFEAGQYEAAAEQFSQAILLSPEDVVLPFTYAQALFAAGDYARAASVLRSALAQIPEDELTIYYPRGLYADDAVLTGQIDQLQAAISTEPFASDYQLLLGYQYLGMGQLDKATVYLPRAAGDPANQPAAEKLLQLAEQLRFDDVEL